MTDNKKNISEYSSASVLVVGVANFLGYHLARSLLDSGQRVIGVDNLITGSQALVDKLSSNSKFVFFRADINQPLPAALYKEKITHIVHLANIEACCGEGNLQLNELLTNSFGVKNLLDLGMDLSVPVVFTSTIDIYQGLASSTNLSHYFDGEETESRLVYNEAKRYAESLCQEYAELYDSDIRVARLSEIYGPQMDIGRGTPFSELLGRGLLGRDLVVEEGVVADKVYLTYVADVVYGLVKLILASASEVKHGIFYLVNPQELNWLKVAKIVLESELQDLQEGQEKPQIRLVSESETDVTFSSPQINLSRSERDLYWKAEVSIRQGVEKTWAFFRENPHLLESFAERTEGLSSRGEKLREVAEPVEDEGEDKEVEIPAPLASSLTKPERDWKHFQAVKEKIGERMGAEELATPSAKGALPRAGILARLRGGLGMDGAAKALDQEVDAGVAGSEEPEDGEAGVVDKGEGSREASEPVMAGERKGWLAEKQKDEEVPGGDESVSSEEPSPPNFEGQTIAGVEAAGSESKLFPTLMKVGVVLILLLLVSLPVMPPLFWGWKTYRGVQQLQSQLGSGDLSAARGEITGLQKNLNHLDRALGRRKVVFSLFGFQRAYDDVTALAAGASFALEGASVCLDGGEDLIQLSETIRSASPPLGGNEGLEISETVDSQVSALSASLESAGRQFSLAQTELAKVETEDLQGLPLNLATRADQVREGVVLINDSIGDFKEVLDLFPTLLGLFGEQKYLVLLQNSSELRATGGFIGSYAEFTFDSGRLEQLRVDDIYNPDGQLGQTEPAPAPLQSQLGVDQLGIRDANWWPHFPVSARKVASLYNQATGKQVHHVVGINLYVIERLLGQLGPVTLTDYEETINAANLFARAELHSEVGFEPGSDQKKRFLTSLSQELITVLLNADNRAVVGSLEVLHSTLQGGDTMMYSSLPRLQSLMKKRKWAGTIPETSKEDDFLAVVDSNVGGNKANFWITRSSNYRLDVDRDGNLIGVLTIKWDHSGESGTWPGGDYVNFLRVYTPKYAVLMNAEGFSSEVQKYVEFDKKVFAGTLTVPVGTSAEVVIKYLLPTEAGFKNKSSYRLRVERQPGVLKEPFSLAMHLPIFLKTKDTSRADVVQSRDEFRWDTTLVDDQEVQLGVVGVD